jgi:formate dehydrogenase subunit beta
MNTVIPVEYGDVLAAVRHFLGRLLERGVVDALYVSLETEDGTILPALVTDSIRLEAANPLAPIMPINGARAVSALTGKHAPARIGAVLRSCEIRALIELVKFQQATLDGAILIGVDCPGTYEAAEFVERGAWSEERLAEYFAAAREGRDPSYDGVALRPACQMCVQPIPDQTDIHIHLFGATTENGIPVTMKDEIAVKLEMAEIADGNAVERHQIAERLLAARSQVREKEMAAIRARLASDGGMAGLFATCIRCHNCMTACPICYCKTCLFKTAAFDHAPDHYLTAARRKGAVRMLGDTMLFHLTRLNHMSTSCVSCGMCTSACPSEIPVGAIFSAVGSQVQAAFDYVPGRNVDEPLPLIAFQTNEWMDVGEGK